MKETVLELELFLKKQTINNLQNLACELMGALLQHGNIGNIGVHNMEKWTKELNEAMKESHEHEHE